MYFYPFDVTTPHIIYALLGAFIVLFGMFSLFLRERLYVGEAIWAFIFGIIIGPYGANIFNPRSWGGSSGLNSEEPINFITLEFTRIVLAIGVFAVGVELPKAYMIKHWKSLFFLLVPVMAWGWLVCAGLIYALIPGVNFLSSLAISACLTPTDPILASAVVGGKWADKHVPAHIRHLLAAESSCNDGATLPFLFFALYLMTELPSIGNALRNWFLILWLYQVILGIVLGSFLGFSFRHLMKFCQRHDLIDRQSYVAQYLSLAFLTIGLTTLIGSDDLLAAFACGTAFAWDGCFNRQTEESVFSSVIDILFNIAAFIFVGAWMPFNKFHKDMGGGDGSIGMGVEVWRLVVLAILVLLLKRLPIMIATYRWIPDVKTWREAVFSGHFGPMGIGAIFISTLANNFLRDFVNRNPSSTSSSFDDRRHQIEVVRVMVQPLVAFMVLCSITIHGLSIPGFSLGRRVHSVSRTWSRRDTTGSGRVGAPDWTNQARLVSRAEDIVINRDLERGDGGGMPLEKTMTMMSMCTLNTSNTDGLKENEETLKSDSINEGVTDSPLDSTTTVSPMMMTTTTQQRYIQIANDGDQDQQNHDQHHNDDSRKQFPPDGECHQTSEWKEGNQRIVERRGTFGDDVEVTVINESMNHHHPSNATGNGNENTRARTGRKIHELERGASEMMMGHSMRDGSVWRNLGFGRRRTGGSEELEMRRDRTRPTTADTLVASEDMEGSCVSDACQDEESGVIRSGPAIGGDAATTTPQERRNPINPPDAINLNLDADDPHPIQTFDDYNASPSNAADNEITEVPRGRRERININNNTRIRPLSRTMSGSSLILTTTTPRIGMEGSSLAGTITPPRGLNSSPLPTTMISPLPPIFPYSPPPATSRSRPMTAPTMTMTTTTIASSTSYPPAPPPPPPLPSLTSRPRTADNSIQHHRLDSIRATSGTTTTTVHRQGHHRTPPRTRESSPSRSVRFVDGGSGSGSGSGKTVLVVEIPPPTPSSIPSRSSSFYRDRQDGRTTLVVDKEEGSRSLNATVSTSRPPTR